MKTKAVQKKFPKEKGEALLKEIIQRVKEVEEDPQFIYHFKTLVLFGSMADPKKTECGDIDLLYEIVVKKGMEDRFADIYQFGLGIKEARKLPKQVLHHVRKRNPRISLHRIINDAMVLLNGPYKILAGDQKTVAEYIFGTPYIDEMRMSLGLGWLVDRTKKLRGFADKELQKGVK